MNHIIVSISLLLAFAVASSYGANCGFTDCNPGFYCCHLWGFSTKSCHSYRKPYSSHSCTLIPGSTSSPSSSSSSGSSYRSIYSYYSIGVGTIVGISLGVLALVIGGIVACVCCCTRGRANQGRVIGANQQVVTTTTTQQPGTVYAHNQQVPQQGYGQQQNIAMAGAAPPPQQGYANQGYNPNPSAYPDVTEKKIAPYPSSHVYQSPQ